MDKSKLSAVIKGKQIEADPSIKPEPKVKEVISQENYPKEFWKYSQDYLDFTGMSGKNTIDLRGCIHNSFAGCPKNTLNLIAPNNKVKSLIGVPDGIEYIDVAGCPLKSLDGLPERFLYLHLCGYGGNDGSTKMRALITKSKEHWHKFKYANADAWVINMIRELTGQKPFPAGSFAEIAGDYSEKHKDPYYSKYSDFHYERNRTPRFFDAAKVPIRSLFGAPVRVKKISVSECELTDLTGTLERVDSYICVSNMKSLTSLRGCPKVGVTAEEASKLEFVPPIFTEEELKCKEKCDYLLELWRDSWMKKTLGCIDVARSGIESFDGIHPEFNGEINAYGGALRSLNDLPDRLYSLDIGSRRSKLEPLNHRLCIDHLLSCDRDQLEAIIDQLELGPEARVAVYTRKGGSECINATDEVRTYIKERDGK